MFDFKHPELLKMNEIGVDTAFIASNKYIVKETVEAGVGVIVSYEEEIERDEIERKINNTAYQVSDRYFEIHIPHKNYLLNIDKPIREQSEQVIKALQNIDLLNMLFYSDILEILKNNKSKDGYDASLQELFIQKREFIKGIGSGKDLIDFITEKTKNNDSEIASSFLSIFGIPGTIYSDDYGKRIIIYDAKNYINIAKEIYLNK